MEGAGPKVVLSAEREGFTFSEQWRNKLLTLISPDKPSNMLESNPNSEDESGCGAEVRKILFL